jgi:hypothetical protein
MSQCPQCHQYHSGHMLPPFLILGSCAPRSPAEVTGHGSWALVTRQLGKGREQGLCVVGKAVVMPYSVSLRCIALLAASLLMMCADWAGTITLRVWGKFQVPDPSDDSTTWALRLCSRHRSAGMRHFYVLGIQTRSVVGQTMGNTASNQSRVTYMHSMYYVWACNVCEVKNQIMLFPPPIQNQDPRSLCMPNHQCQ